MSADDHRAEERTLMTGAEPDGAAGSTVTATLLGCGGSLGVPVLGIGWGSVDPAEPRNRRLRPSLYVETGDAKILVDASPDCRQQLLGVGHPALDCVIFTHDHADHTHGLDDLRPLTYRRGGPLAAYANATTIASLERRFGYALTSVEIDRGLYRPILDVKPMPSTLTLGGTTVSCFRQAHGSGTSLGLRFGPIVYSTDVSALDEAVFDSLAGVPVWIVDACREEPHPSHSHLAQTLAWIERVKPGLAILTHMNHTMDYRKLANSLPDGVIPGHDGLRVEVAPGTAPRVLDAAIPCAPGP